MIVVEPMEHVSDSGVRAAQSLLVVLVMFVQYGCGQDENRSFQNACQKVVRGQYTEAEKMLKEYIKAEPQGKQASRAGLFLFKVCVAQGRLDEATEWCEWTQEPSQVLGGPQVPLQVGRCCVAPGEIGYRLGAI